MKRLRVVGTRRGLGFSSVLLSLRERVTRRTATFHLRLGAGLHRSRPLSNMARSHVEFVEGKSVGMTELGYGRMGNTTRAERWAKLRSEEQHNIAADIARDKADSEAHAEIVQKRQDEAKAARGKGPPDA